MPAMPKKKDEEDILCTVTQASHIIDVSTSTVRNLEKRGILPATKVGNGERLFWRSDCERVAAERRKGPHAARPVGGS